MSDVEGSVKRAKWCIGLEPEVVEKEEKKATMKSSMDVVDISRLPQTEDTIMACVLPPSKKGYDEQVDDFLQKEIENSMKTTGSSPFMASLYEGQKTDIHACAPMAIRDTLAEDIRKEDIAVIMQNTRSRLTVIEREVTTMTQHMLGLVTSLQKLEKKFGLRI